jgi:hypothetical protein
MLIHIFRVAGRKIISLNKKSRCHRNVLQAVTTKQPLKNYSVIKRDTKVNE